MCRNRLASVLAGIGIGASTLAVAIGPARGHVDYVTDGSGDRLDALRFVVDVITEPANAALFVGTGALVLVAVLGYLRYRPARADVAVVRQTLSAYRDLVPWILRLSLGLPLVGAGFAGYFFSPAVPAEARLFQVGVGFLLLFGLASRLVAGVALFAYVAGLAIEPALLLASEFVGGLLGIVILGSGRPSADQVLQRVAADEDTIYSHVDPIHGVSQRVNDALEPYEDYAATVVRVGLGLNFVFLGLNEKLLTPGRALLVVEKYELTSVVPVDPGVWVVGAGVTEIAVGLALVVGLFTRAAAGVAFVMFTLTLLGLPDDPVLAHVSLFGLASALMVTASGPLAVDNVLHGRTRAVETSTGEPVPGEH